LKLRNLHSLEDGADLPEEESGKLSTAWTAGMLDPEEKAKFVEYLVHQSQLFEVLRKLVSQRYKQAGERQFDFSNPNVKDSMLYYEGYKQALRDIHKILPNT